jgi:hypothetical protein
MHHTEPGITVMLSSEGLRRARADNALLASVKRRETLHAWVFAIALGILLGWAATWGLAK